MKSQQEIIESILGTDEGKSKVISIAGILVFDGNEKDTVKEAYSVSAVIKSIFPSGEDVIVVMDFGNEYEKLKAFYDVFNEAVLVSEKVNGKTVIPYLSILPVKLAGEYGLTCTFPCTVLSEPTPQGEASSKLYLTFKEKFVSLSMKNFEPDNYEDYLDEYESYEDEEYQDEDEGELLEDYDDFENYNSEEDDLYD